MSYESRTSSRAIDSDAPFSRVTAGPKPPFVASALRLFAWCNAADGGESHSAEAVRYQIKGLIDTETPVEILSDDRIVEILRRTVAKYRESLRIPSSVERKRKLAHGL